MKAHWLFGIIAVPVLFATPALAVTMVQAPPGGLDVHVANPPEDPVPVTIQGQPATPEPYQQLATNRREDQSFIFALFPPVPDGYRLEIHDVAGQTTAKDPSGGALPRVSECYLTNVPPVGTVGNVVARDIPPGASIARMDGSEVQQFADSVLIYIAAGEQPRVDCIYQMNVPDVTIRAHIAGILVPVVE